MWIRSQFPVFARMPSMRPASLNPRAPAMPGAEPPSSRTAAPLSGTPPATPAGPGKRQVKGVGSAATEREKVAEAARAGGFHESSYELQSGLQITESEWPDDVTVPGALGER